MSNAEKVKTALRAKWEDAVVLIQDPRSDDMHLEAIVVTNAFEGLTTLKRQRLVMEVLKELFSTSLHALSLKTFTKEQWDARKAL